MNTNDINNQQMAQQMSEVNKSSNMYVGTTIFIMLAIIVVGLVFG